MQRCSVSQATRDAVRKFCEVALRVTNMARRRVSKSFAGDDTAYNFSPIRQNIFAISMGLY